MPTIKSSPDRFNEFIHSELFADYLAELDLRIARFSFALEDHDMELSFDKINRIQGAIAALRQMKNIFHDLHILSADQVSEATYGDS